MKPITEGVAVVDEEEGSLDSFSNVGAPTSPQRRPLQGLDRELSTKFGPTSPTVGDDNSTNSSGRQAGPSFTDYLQAQKKLQSRRRLSQTDLLLQRSASNTSDTAGGGIGNSSRRLYGSDIGTNIAVASAVAKLRAKAKESAEQQTSPTNQITQPQTTSAAKQSAYTSNKQITSFGWDEIFTELQNIDEDGHFLDHHTHIVPWYGPPIQRQRWREDSVLPHVNWGDLFFDLFYVAMVRLLLVLYVVYVGGV